MAARDFDAEVAERARERDPIEFTLGGVTFTGRPLCPFGAVLDLADAPEITVDVAGAVRKTNADVAYQCVQWLSEQYAGRPTVPSSESAVSPQPDGRDSSSEPHETATAA